MADGIDTIVTRNKDSFRSGVARFNELLADRLGVPLLGLFDRELSTVERPLLSFKVSELSSDESNRLAQILEETRWQAELFLHEYLALELERRLIERAAAVHCGNLEIYQRVQGLSADVDVLWAPGLLIDDRVFEPTDVSVFSFGMAHKIRSEMFRRLRDLLETSGKTWAVYLSAANHETSSMRDAELVLEEARSVLSERLYFLGNLSDVAVSNYLRETTFFAAFFANGVRANNTSVASAMERGAVVITNLDEHSPVDLVHMDNVIDIHRCHELPIDPVVLAGLGRRARETAAARGWEQLVARLLHN